MSSRRLCCRVQRQRFGSYRPGLSAGQEVLGEHLVAGLAEEGDEFCAVADPQRIFRRVAAGGGGAILLEILPAVTPPAPVVFGDGGAQDLYAVAAVFVRLQAAQR